MKINGVELPECSEPDGQEMADEIAYPGKTKHQLMILLQGNCPWCGWDHPDTETTLATPKWTVHR